MDCENKRATSKDDTDVSSKYLIEKILLNNIQPKNFIEEKTTMWSFPDRGDWATHKPHYRGNWSPHVVRNIILKYSEPGDLVLDPMVGGGTTPVECVLTGRNSISVDLNPNAIQITNNCLKLPRLHMKNGTHHETYVKDARNLNFLRDNSIDLVVLHPPYCNIIKYSDIREDLSTIDDFFTFFNEFRKVICECKRVLKPGKFCAVLMGDTHRNGHYIPLSTKLLFDFLRNDFILKEEIIKKEWNCKSEKKYSKHKMDYLLTAHEHLYVFRTPLNEKDILPLSCIDLFIQ